MEKKARGRLVRRRRRSERPFSRAKSMAARPEGQSAWLKAVKKANSAVSATVRGALGVGISVSLARRPTNRPKNPVVGARSVACLGAAGRPMDDAKVCSREAEAVGSLATVSAEAAAFYADP